MDRLSILESLDFGQDAAEHEENLHEVFVSTDGYRRLLADHVDVVQGYKGTGKTALYRMITESDFGPQVHDDLIVVSAVNPTGSVVFKRLFREDSSEDRLRVVWTAYLACLIGNRIIEEYVDEPATRQSVTELLEILEQLGLRHPEERRRSLLNRIRRARSLKPELTASSTGELSFGLSFDLDDAELGADTRVNLEHSDFLALIAVCADVLQWHGRRLWVAIDRLDECFTRDSPVERRALRALLRTHLDVAQHIGYRDHLRLKVFLRSDLLRRMSSDAVFTNSTHLRTSELLWNAQNIVALVGERALRSPVFTASLGAVDPRADVNYAAWTHLLPAEMGGGKSDRVLCEWTTDGHRSYNPRNVLALLRIALHRRLRRERERPSQLADGEPLLDYADIASAHGRLSTKRLQDTVLNEFPMIERYLPRLEGLDAEFRSAASLSEVLGLEDQSREAETALKQLLLSGLVAQKESGYVVPRLYRPALKMTTSVRRKPRRPKGSQPAVVSVLTPAPGLLVPIGR